MHITWVFILISIQSCQGISLRIDGTLNFNPDLSKRAFDDTTDSPIVLQKLGMEMLNIIMQNHKKYGNLGKSLLHPKEEVSKSTTKEHKKGKSLLHSKEDVSTSTTIKHKKHRNATVVRYTAMDPELIARTVSIQRKGDKIKHELKKKSHKKVGANDSPLEIAIENKLGDHGSITTKKHKLQPNTERHRDIVKKTTKTRKKKTLRNKHKVEVTTKTTELTRELTRAGMLKVGRYTTPEVSLQKDIYVEPHKVKEVDKIKEVTNHIYEESIKVFDNIKDQINDYRLKKEVDRLKRTYEIKFGEFVRETQDQNVKTRLGHHKVVLNTVETSNKIMQRLFNHLLVKFDEKGMLRNKETNNVLKAELVKKKAMDNLHVCKELNICRSDTSFSNFFIDIINIILSSDDKKVRVMANAFTEVLKSTDMSNVMSLKAEKSFQKGLEELDKFNVIIVRAIFGILKNILANRNVPLKVFDKIDSRVNKTLALLEILDILDKKLPPDEQNRLAWQDLTNSFKEWKDGKRHDNNDLAQSLSDQVMKAVNSFNDEERTVFYKNMDIIVS